MTGIVCYISLNKYLVSVHCWKLVNVHKTFSVHCWKLVNVYKTFINYLDVVIRCNLNLKFYKNKKNMFLDIPNCCSKDKNINTANHS